MARARFRRNPFRAKSEPEPKVERLERDVAEARAKTPVHRDDPALLDEPALRAAPAEAMDGLGPTTMHADNPMVGNDSALLDDVGGIESRPEVGGLAEGDDLGIDPDANNPLGVGAAGLELNPDGNFHPAEDLLGNLDSGKPEGGFDESAAGGITEDLIQGAANQLAGAGNTEQMRQLKLVDDGIGETSKSIPHGDALDAVEQDDADGPTNTPSQSGMPEGLSEEELTQLADDISKVKATLGPDEVKEVYKHGKTFVVKGAAETTETDDSDKDETKPEAGSEPAGATEDYIDGEDPLLGRTDHQQQYQDMKIDAIRGSEVNPEGTEEFYGDVEMPNFDDISGANDPLGVLEIETPAHLDGIVHDGGVIDPVD